MMIKKHQKRSIYATFQRTSLKLLLKRTFELTKENPNMEENLCWYELMSLPVYHLESYKYI